MTFRTLDDLDLAGKRVLIRVDINAPFKDGAVTDDTRLRGIIPTIRDVMAAGGKPILLAHFGRPKGQYVKDMSVAPLVAPLSYVLETPVRFGPNCIGEDAATAIRDVPAGEILVLENTRFHRGEETNDPAFAADVAALGDVFVNDAFSVSHREIGRAHV